MSKKNIDSGPISHLEAIFNVKQESAKNKGYEISLLTEIHDQKVIMDFQWIKDLNVLITSFSIDNYEYSFLTHHINKINNNLIIGTLKQNTNNKIVYKHSLPIAGQSTSEFRPASSGLKKGASKIVFHHIFYPTFICHERNLMIHKF